jgi:hypothetical protein
MPFDTQPIAIFVGGNGDPTNFFAGKNSVSTQDRIGGGGANYSSRLLSMSYLCVPVLTFGIDRDGTLIRNHILNIAKQNRVPEEVIGYISSDKFLEDGSEISDATIPFESEKRTILINKPTISEYYSTKFRKRMRYIDELFGPSFSAIIIGHLSVNNNNNDSGPSGNDPTRTIVEYFSDRGTIFVNFGMSQLQKRYRFWQGLISKIDVLQFNLLEARLFFSDTVGSSRLSDIVQFIRNENLSVIITIDHFGALIFHRDRRDQTILVWPIIDDNDVILDATGAGDAFLSVVVSCSAERGGTAFPDIKAGVDRGRE